MDEKLMNRILQDKEVKFSELPDGFDIESLPKDAIIIFDDDDPTVEDEYWED